MSLTYPYQLERMPHALVSLGGRFVRPRPIVSVTLLGPLRSLARDALLDPGSDDTVFPDWAARWIGLDLTHAPTGHALGVGAGPVPLRYAQVKLRLTDGKEYREWPAWVGFTTARLRQPLLGFAGCLQFFTATYQGDREQVELAINALYSGT